METLKTSKDVEVKAKDNINNVEPLKQHQKDIIDKDPKWWGLWLGTGSGKSRIALELAQGKTLVICPKQQKLDKTWEKNAERFKIYDKGVSLKVISKEELKNKFEDIFYEFREKEYTTLIIDEAHYFFTGLGPFTRIKKGEETPVTSLLLEALMIFLKHNKPNRLYMLSATPASKPFHVWTIAGLFNFPRPDYYRFRARYYIENRAGARRLFFPKKDKELQDNLLMALNKMGSTGQLSDWNDVPDQTERVVYFEPNTSQKIITKEQSIITPDPNIFRMYQRQIDNGILYSTDIQRGAGANTDIIVKTARMIPSEKDDYITLKATEFKKFAIFANYTAQINKYEEMLTKLGYYVVTLTGKTKDRAGVIQDIESRDEGIIIIQTSISEGYELKSINVMIFASLSNKVRDEIQGRGRLLRLDAIKKNLYLYLVTRGGADESCYKSIKDGKDFVEKMYDYDK